MECGELNAEGDQIKHLLPGGHSQCNGRAIAVALAQLGKAECLGGKLQRFGVFNGPSRKSQRLELEAVPPSP